MNSALPRPSGHDTGPVGWQFSDPDLLDTLESVPLSAIDDATFGLIVMDRDGIVLGYNRRESRLSGLPPAGVIGRNFFIDIGPCTNNYLVAQRYANADGGELDEQLDYVFTFRMAPTPVRLRLLARKGSTRQYLAVLPR